MPIVEIRVSGVYWPEVDTASLACRVQSQNFGFTPPEVKVFHDRKLEVLAHGGDPSELLLSMARFGVLRWTKLRDMWAPSL